MGGDKVRLINNAGILAEGCCDAFPLPSFRRIFEVNYFGVVNCTRSVLPLMQARAANIFPCKTPPADIGDGRHRDRRRRYRRLRRTTRA